MRVTRAAATVSKKVDIYYYLIGEVGANHGIVAQLGTERKSSVTYSRTLRCLSQN